ncbi:MAG TPA: TOBE domain-containing protein [Candidatus Limnocylindria bacterium]
MARKGTDSATATVRIGRAAEVLGVSVATLRRWEAEGRLRSLRTEGGQRRVALTEVERLRRGRAPRRRPVVAQSARNRFTGVVTRVERDTVAAVVEIQCGPHRFVSLVTREAVDELALEIGDEAVVVVKATNVMVEVPARR